MLNRYLETLRKCCKPKGDIIISADNFKIDAEKFSIEYIRQVTGKKIRSNIKIFLHYIGLGVDIFPLHILKDVKKEPDVFIQEMLTDPYKTNKKYKLHLPIKYLDEIYTYIFGEIKQNDVMRVNYILKKIFKMRYLGVGEFWMMLDSNYDIDDITLVTDLIEVYDNKYVMLKEYAEMQREIYDYFINLSKSDTFLLETDDKIEKLDDIQKNIYHECVKNNFVIISGKPGTGKSEIIGSLLNKFPNTLVLAPTGCAVENIQRRFSEHKSKVYTLHCYYYAHKMYDYIQQFRDIGDKCVIIDEFSMVDMLILHKVITLLKQHIDESENKNIKIILVGDKNQLPSIYLGQLLYDFINSGKFKVFHLEKCYRSNSGIVKVLDNLLTNNKIAVVKDTVIPINCPDPSDFKKIVGNNLYEYFLDKENVILAPTNAVINVLNDYIQRLNPNKVVYNNKSILKKYDKIIFLKNKPDDKIYNGTILYILSVSEIGKEIMFTFLSSPTDENEITFKCDIDEVEKYIKLCYGMTIHKSQASGFKNVFLLLDTYPELMWDIKLIYTAISRAKEKCYISGKPSEINKSCQYNKLKISYFV
jgi:exodeoxyribonuclease V alpha subunit